MRERLRLCREHVSVQYCDVGAQAGDDLWISHPATPDEPEVREVILDRPFVYFIIDNMTLTPLFVGAMASMG